MFRMLAAGDYVHSERDLYCIEQVGPKRAVVEDCKTGELVAFPVPYLMLLEPVRAA